MRIPTRRWDGQYPSLWVTDGGGGTFFDIWTPSSFSMAGMLISDTTTRGRVYEMSSEHHVRYEVQIRNAANWELYALQTEEERGEGGVALPLEIDNSRNITLANFHLYKVISSFQPFPWAVKVTNSQNIRFRNFHSYSNSKVAFDVSVFDQTRNVEVRQREFAWLDLSGAPPPAADAEAVVGARSRRDGTEAGRRVLQHLGRRRAPERATSTSSTPAGSGSTAGPRRTGSCTPNATCRWIPSTSPSTRPATRWSCRTRAPARSTPSSLARRSTRWWSSSRSTPRRGQASPPCVPSATGAWPRTRQRACPPAKAHHFLSPDGTTFIAAGKDFVTGASSWGVKSADLLRAFGLAAGQAGPAVLPDQRSRGRDLARDARPRRQLHRLHALRPAGRRRPGRGRAGPRLPGGRPDLRVRPVGSSDRHHRNA